MEQQKIAGTVGTKKERNLGIELLRLISMLMIVIWHCLQGGILDNVKSPLNVGISWLLLALCYVCVDLYALTTGYVCVQGRHRWQRILELWLEVLFYSLACTAVSFIWRKSVDLKQLLLAFFPVASRTWWYFSAYFLLFFMIPLLNKLALSLSKQNFARMLVVIGTVLCTVGWLSSYIGKDAFSLLGGNSPLWLAYLYLVGAYFKIYPKAFIDHKYIYIYI